VVVLNGESRKTKIIRRGGQHPEWDEEIRFTIYEDSEDLNASDDGSPPPLPPKAGRGPKKIQGGEKMVLACFAADKEPELIGETMVDLNEVLTKGETDGTISKISLLCLRTHTFFQNGSRYITRTSTAVRSTSSSLFGQMCVAFLYDLSISRRLSVSLGTTPREESHAKVRKGSQTIWWSGRFCSIGGIPWSSSSRQW